MEKEDEILEALKGIEKELQNLNRNLNLFSVALNEELMKIRWK